MNSLDVRAQFESESKELYTEILIDERLLVNHRCDNLAIDLVELVKTMEHDGEFFIITCTCGDPGCAGITKGIHVHRTAETVQWQFKVQQVDSENMQTMTFAEESYLIAIQRGLVQFTELYQLHRDAEIVPYLMRERIASLKVS